MTGQHRVVVAGFHDTLDNTYVIVTSIGELWVWEYEGTGVSHRDQWTRVAESPWMEELGETEPPVDPYEYPTQEELAEVDETPPPPISIRLNAGDRGVFRGTVTNGVIVSEDVEALAMNTDSINDVPVHPKDARTIPVPKKDGQMYSFGIDEVLIATKVNGVWSEWWEVPT